MKESRFKSHMIRFADGDGSFRSFCGITEGSCSEDFYYDMNTLKGYGDSAHTNCKKCLSGWKKEEAEIDKIIKGFEELEAKQYGKYKSCNGSEEVEIEHFDEKEPCRNC